jgi:carboxyl-terminal processing protease
MTASAAELLAAALQDYGRAVLVGGHYSTYGKGSVQTVVDLGDVIRDIRPKDADQLGAIQLTIAKFYRVNGQSTQLRGLTADIQLPSPEDLPDDGESDLDNPLPYDEIKPARAAELPPVHLLPVAQLKVLSTSRVATDTEFRYLEEDIQRETSKDQLNKASLNEITRRAELDGDKTRARERETERKLRKSAGLDETIIPVSLHEAVKGAARTAKASSGAANTASAPATAGAGSAVKPDEMRAEALNILDDLVRLTAKKSVTDGAVADNTTAPKPAPAAKTP